MKTIKKMGVTGITSAALVLLAPSTSLAEGLQGQSAESGNLVHRVSHALANTQQYTGKVVSGNKWGSPSTSHQSRTMWADSPEPQSGYKWGQSKSGIHQSANAGVAKQTGKRWGRGSFSEQSGKRWGRGSFSEQSGKRWGRGSFSEQSGKRWGRGSFSEQTGNRWGRG